MTPRSSWRSGIATPTRLLLRGRMNFCLLVLLVQVIGLRERTLVPSSCHDGHDDGDGDGDGDDDFNPKLDVKPVLRVPNAISVAEFEALYSHPKVAIPIVFEHTAFDATPWTREAIKKECGHKWIIDGRIPFCRELPNPGQRGGCHSVRFVDPKLLGKEWAGLNLADVDALNITTLGDLLDVQDAMAEGRQSSSQNQLYLHDAPLTHYCPSAMDRVQIPKFFPRDYASLETDPRILQKKSWGLDHFPSVFISKKGTGSPLHADSQMTRFWIRQVSGQKLWRIVPYKDNWRLYPPSSEDREYHPTVFDADIMDPDFDAFPLLNGLTVYETTLQPGDVLFIPSGWAHQVLNVQDAISVGYNFVDNHALEEYINFCKHTKDKEEYELMEAFFMPLDNPTRGSNAEEDIDMREFYTNQHFQRIDVPTVVKRWVQQSKGTDGINAYRDSRGRPALHAAVMHNFLSVVKYLIEHGAVDVNLKDGEGLTALDYAKKFDFQEVKKVLETHGGLRKSVIGKGIGDEM